MGATITATQESTGQYRVWFPDGTSRLIDGAEQTMFDVLAQAARTWVAEIPVIRALTDDLAVQAQADREHFLDAAARALCSADDRTLVTLGDATLSILSQLVLRDRSALVILPSDQSRELPPNDPALRAITSDVIASYVAEVEHWQPATGNNACWCAFEGASDIEGKPLEIVLPRQQTPRAWSYMANAVNLLAALHNESPYATIGRIFHWTFGGKMIRVLVSFVMT